MSELGRQCETCHFWERHPSDKSGQHGYCCRFPSACMVTMLANRWCGEWKSRAIADLAELVDTYGHGIKYATHDIGIKSRCEHPGFGWCLRCGQSNAVTETEFASLKYGDYDSMSPLCKDCWERCSREERLVYCRALFRSWQVAWLGAAWSANVIVPDDHPDWLAIETAVMECMT